MQYVILSKKDSKILTDHMFTLSHIFLDRNQLLLLKLAVWFFRTRLPPEFPKNVANYLETLRPVITETELLAHDDSLIPALNESVKILNKYAKMENE